MLDPMSASFNKIVALGRWAADVANMMSLISIRLTILATYLAFWSVVLASGSNIIFAEFGLPYLSIESFTWDKFSSEIIKKCAFHFLDSSKAC